MDTIRRTPETAFDWQALIHPAAAYAHPRDVLADPHLSVFEKRAILSSWASDACAVADAPALRHPPGAREPVTFDVIVEALRSLDDDPPPGPRPGGKSARRPPWLGGRDEEQGGMPFAA